MRVKFYKVLRRNGLSRPVFGNCRHGYRRFSYGESRTCVPCTTDGGSLPRNQAVKISLFVAQSVISLRIVRALYTIVSF